ncbi:hypothetical protein [Corynebacterium bouchesdurhonense]|uniref:hypothetical protein n=1 Tax=Corynebacterium bouchesdurhonense TaxID=1720192 RepID=UPI0008316DD0|nr:hypothetical protein [Corynebacterium bouchesdurhonense]
MSVIITAVASRAPKDEVVAQLHRQVTEVSRLVTVAPGAGASTKAQARLLGDDICKHLSHFSGMDLGDFNGASRNLGDEGFGAAQFDAAQYGAAACYPASAGRWLSSIGAVARDKRDAEAEQQFFVEARGTGEQMRACSRAVDKVFGATAVAVGLILEAPLRLLRMTLGAGVPQLVKMAAEMAVAGLRAAAEAVKDGVETVRAILGRIAERIGAAACRRPAPPVGYDGGKGGKGGKGAESAEGTERCTGHPPGDGTRVTPPAAGPPVAPPAGGTPPAPAPVSECPGPAGPAGQAGPAGPAQAAAGAQAPVSAAGAGTTPAAAVPQVPQVPQTPQAPAVPGPGGAPGVSVTSAQTPAAPAATTVPPAASRTDLPGSADAAARSGAAPARTGGAPSYERLCRCAGPEPQAPGAVQAPGENGAAPEAPANRVDGAATGERLPQRPSGAAEGRGLTITFDFTLEATVNASLGCLDGGVAELFRTAGAGEGLRTIIGPWAQSGATAVMGGIEHLRNRIHEILACPGGGGEPPAPPAPPAPPPSEPCPAPPPPADTVPAQQQVAAPPPELARVPEPAPPAEKVAHVAAQGAGNGGQGASTSKGPEPALSSGAHARIEGKGSATWGIKKAGQW